MAKQTINNNEPGLSVRTKLNDNFTEVYDATTAYQSVSASFATKTSVNALSSAILSNTTGVTSASAISNIIVLPQASYNAISLKSPTTLYIIA